MHHEFAFLKIKLWFSTEAVRRPALDKPTNFLKSIPFRWGSSAAGQGLAVTKTNFSYARCRRLLVWRNGWFFFFNGRNEFHFIPQLDSTLVWGWCCGLPITKICFGYAPCHRLLVWRNSRIEVFFKMPKIVVVTCDVIYHCHGECYERMHICVIRVELLWRAISGTRAHLTEADAFPLPWLFVVATCIVTHHWASINVFKQHIEETNLYLPHIKPDKYKFRNLNGYIWRFHMQLVER